MNELSEKLSSLAVEDNSNSIALGDLTIHLNDGQIYDSQRLNEIITLLGYKQNVNFYTHIAGHTLDAVIREFDSGLII